MKKKSRDNIIAYIILIAMGVLMIYPLIWLFFATFKDNQELFGKMSLFPERVSFEAFRNGWQGSGQFTYKTF